MATCIAALFDLCQAFEVWPMFLILNVISALEGTFLDFFYDKKSENR